MAVDMLIEFLSKNLAVKGVVSVDKVGSIFKYVCKRLLLELWWRAGNGEVHRSGLCERYALAYKKLCYCAKAGNRLRGLKGDCFGEQELCPLFIGELVGELMVQNSFMGRVLVDNDQFIVTFDKNIGAKELANDDAAVKGNGWINVGYAWFWCRINRCGVCGRHE